MKEDTPVLKRMKTPSEQIMSLMNHMTKHLTHEGLPYNAQIWIEAFGNNVLLPYSAAQHELKCSNARVFNKELVYNQNTFRWTQRRTLQRPWDR